MLRYIFNSLQSFKDAYRLIQEKEKFILGDLADRAMQSKEGYQLVYAIPFFRFYPIAVLTGEEIIKKVLVDVNIDSESRKMFDPFERFIGVKTLINEADLAKAGEERKIIKDRFLQGNIDLIIDRVLSELDQEWDRKPVERVVRIACVRIIAEVLLGVKEGITDDTIDLLEEAENYIFHPDKMEESGFQLVHRRLQEASKTLMQKNKASMTSETQAPYLFYVAKKNENLLEEINIVASLVVEANVTHLVTGILSEMKRTPLWENKFREALNKRNNNNNSKAFSFLDQLYFEGLRCFPPKHPIVRFGSKSIEPFPKGTMFFIPLEKIMSDQNIWKEPKKFNPLRHKSNHHIQIGKYPWIMFSLNESRRVCPAAYSSFAKRMVEKILACYCKKGFNTEKRYYLRNYKLKKPVADPSACAPTSQRLPKKFGTEKLRP